MGRIQAVEMEALSPTDQESNIRISEIFGPTIQGEGALIGKPTVFVRTGGCDYRCSWCDTLHAVESKYRHEWLEMATKDVWSEVERLSNYRPLTVSLSGGNPAIQPLQPLIELGKHRGYSFALETQGSIAKDWFRALDILTISPKPPSSEMRTDWSALEECLRAASNGPRIVLKFVVFNEDDYTYAKATAAKYSHLSVYLQPGNHTPPGNTQNDPLDTQGIINRMKWLINRVNEDCWYTATILPQLHVLLWGNLRGV